MELVRLAFRAELRCGRCIFRRGMSEWVGACSRECFPGVGRAKRMGVHAEIHRDTLIAIRSFRVVIE
jgi:hypothetical protein